MQSSPSSPAACAAPWVGGEAGQPGTNLLRQPREQDHPMAQTHHPVMITYFKKTLETCIHKTSNIHKTNMPCKYMKQVNIFFRFHFKIKDKL